MKSKSLRRAWLWMVLGVLGGVILVVLLQSVSATDRPVVINGTSVPPVPTLDLDRATRGASLYAQYCASCHGANLEGAPDWKQRLPDGSFAPPPHDNSGHTWHHADSLLLQIMAEGGDPSYGSKMPGFQDKLTYDELSAVLEFLKSRWGREEREFQWWITKTQPTS